MGNEGKSKWGRAGWPRPLARQAVVLLAALAFAACSASPRPAESPVGSAVTGGAATAADAQATAGAPMVVRSLAMQPSGEGVSIEVGADQPLVWTSFRDAEGRLIVELANSVPGPGVSGASSTRGVIASVAVEREHQAGRPLTRLVVSTRQEVEHSVAGGADGLSIQLTPLASGSTVALAYEPLPDGGDADPVAAMEPAAPFAAEDEGEEIAAAVDDDEAEVPRLSALLEHEQPAAVAADAHSFAGTDSFAGTHSFAGTPERPFVSPPPTGAAARTVDGVAVDPTGQGTIVRVLGDGQFSYSTFALDNPHRFVIDLDGVIDGSDRQTLPVGRGSLDRVRVAQFRGGADPVARVVFDLASPAVPRIERAAAELVVVFNGVHAGAASAAPGTPRQAAPPSAVQPAAARMAAPVPQQPVVREPLDPDPYDVPITNEPDDPTSDEVQIRTVPEPVEPPPAREARPAPRRTPASDLALTSPGGLQIDTPTTPPPAFSPRSIDGGERQYVGERYSFSLRDADLVETLRSFATMSGLNMVIQPGVSGTVTMELNDVPWDQAFEQVLKINGLSYEVEGNIMRIAPIGTLQAEAQGRQELERAQALSIPLRTVMRRLSYASATQVEGLLRRGILSQRGSVIVDPRTNTLIIRELPNYLDTVIAVIENIDIAEPLVMIEARIVETRKNFTRTLGIEWSFGGVSAPEFGNTTGLVFPNQGTVDGGVNLLTGGNNAFIDLTLGNVLNTFNLDLALQAAENEGLVNILSSPKVQALNNQQASIQSGFQIPIQTVANNTVSVQFVNATLKLDVRPQVTAEGTVLMDINIQKRNPEFGLTIAGSPNAPISTKEAQTRVMVRDGGTTVIGGIYEVSSNQGEDRVPGLANIPIIGHLFKNRRIEDQNNELLIFITPRVIRF
jgi:type IV pilus secretin PilQ/predicted competence protein